LGVSSTIALAQVSTTFGDATSTQGIGISGTGTAQ